jgi:RND family efflux transporter MFP subunit
MLVCAVPSVVAAAGATEGYGAVPRVEATTASTSAVTANVSITGDIEARYLTDISFRTTGKLASRAVEVGAHVDANDVLAKLDPQQQLANVNDAEARLSSANSALAQAERTFDRQQTLLAGGGTSQVAYDQADLALVTAKSQVESAQAYLEIMREQLSFTDLRAEVAGIITARSAEVGQVVKAGQTVYTLAQDGPRDAVFNVYESLLANLSRGAQIDVMLVSNPRIRATATLRELAPMIDAASGTVKVKATIDSSPPEMTLGSVVVGSAHVGNADAITLPSSALFRWDGQPAVWIVDPKLSTVSLRTVKIERYGDARIVLSGGVSAGDRVVTAGAQFLRPGVKVIVVNDNAP